MDYTEQILKLNDPNYSLDKYADNSQSNLELPPRVRVLSGAEEDVAEEDKSQENTGDSNSNRQTGEGHSMSKSKIHD